MGFHHGYVDRLTIPRMHPEVYTETQSGFHSAINIPICSTMYGNV